MNIKVKLIKKYLRSKISCIHCAGELCNLDGSHDAEEIKEMANYIEKLLTIGAEKES